MTKDEALKLALEALKMIDEAMPFPVAKLAQSAIKEALAQQDSKDKEQAKTDSFVRQLDEALAQPNPWEKFCDSNCVWTDHHPDCKLAEQEPVAWLHPDWPNYTDRQSPVTTYMVNGWTPLYTTPPQRKPLTDEEIILIVAECASSHQHTDIHFARAIEAAHGIKRLV